jgi:hypothetical protein
MLRLQELKAEIARILRTERNWRTIAKTETCAMENLVVL